MAKFKYITFPITNNEDADQPVHVHMLVFIFALSVKQNQEFGDKARIDWLWLDISCSEICYIRFRV